jgi:hypothetical protein
MCRKYGLAYELDLVNRRFGTRAIFKSGATLEHRHAAAQATAAGRPSQERRSLDTEPELQTAAGPQSARRRRVPVARLARTIAAETALRRVRRHHRPKRPCTPPAPYIVLAIAIWEKCLV